MNGVGLRQLSCLVGFGALLWAQDSSNASSNASSTASGENCTFRNDPDAYLSREGRARKAVFEQAGKMSRHLAGASRSVAPSTIPRRNFIDDQIFGRLEKAGIRSAPVAGDEEFLRRIYLDLTGRIPSPEDVRKFVSDPSVGKRSEVIDRLLFSEEFIDRWSMWLGDLYQINISTTNVNRGVEGRNKYNDWVRKSINEDVPLKDMAYQAITARGNTYNPDQGAANYVLLGRQVMGPNQDWYDLMFSQAAEKFLGVSHYDCLLCHDGRRRLDELSLWGKGITRTEAQRMAAFFSRVSLAQPYNADRLNPLNGSWEVSDRTTGNYVLGTTFGNRPNRTIVGTVRNLDPEYRDGSKPKSGDWRSEFAENVMVDPLLPVNFANRVWKALFNYGLVEPVNSLDPARLDPDNPPPAPWALQASHPELLRILSLQMWRVNFSLREFVRMLVESSAYQLSTRYEGEWNVSQVPLFARHYARRLEGEEIHDAIVKATGVFQEYTVGAWGGTTPWAGRLPDPQEPRSNGAVLNFMNSFLRGNRDTVQRNQAGSILQELNMMNDLFVLNRIRVASSPTLRAVSQLSDNAAAVDEMFLLFLARTPSASERSAAVAHLAKGTNAAARNAMIEDLAWALINKAEFLFSY